MVSGIFAIYIASQSVLLVFLSQMTIADSVCVLGYSPFLYMYMYIMYVIVLLSIIRCYPKPPDTGGILAHAHSLSEVGSAAWDRG